MVVALKFYDLVFAGIAAGQANGAHTGFGAAAHHTEDQVDIRHHAANQFSHLYFQLGR